MPFHTASLAHPFAPREHTQLAGAAVRVGGSANLLGGAAGYLGTACDEHQIRKRLIKRQDGRQRLKWQIVANALILTNTLLPAEVAAVWIGDCLGDREAGLALIVAVEL